MKYSKPFQIILLNLFYLILFGFVVHEDYKVNRTFNWYDINTIEGSEDLIIYQITLILGIWGIISICTNVIQLIIKNKNKKIRSELIKFVLVISNGLHGLTMIIIGGVATVGAILFIMESSSDRIGVSAFLIASCGAIWLGILEVLDVIHSNNLSNKIGNTDTQNILDAQNENWL